jgi:hypothetical protein
MLKSKYFGIATSVSSYVGNRQIHGDLRVPVFFSDHIRTLTESFDSKISDVGNPLVRKLERHLRIPTAVRSYPRLSAGQSRLALIRQPNQGND